jgi:UTP--glucose-1-phosphate uridylyltransferase
VNRLIDRAIVPAAGLGTRLRPITDAIPKEMLPLGRKPVLEHILEELRGAGIRRVLFVIAPGKEMIERYFGNGAAWDVHCDYVIQPEMRGLGDAVLHGEGWADARPFLCAFGDCVIESRSEASPSRRLADVAGSRQAIGVLAERVQLAMTNRYGVLQPAHPDQPTDDAEEPFEVTGVVEKPAPERAPSRFAVAGRWALVPEVFEFLRREPPGPAGEIGLSPAVAAMLSRGHRGWAVPLGPGARRRDIGAWDTYLTATAEYAVQDTDFGPIIRAAICHEVSASTRSAEQRTTQKT